MSDGSQTYLTCGVFAGKGATCLGVDVGIAPDGAPAGECLRVYYGADDDLALGFELAFLFLGPGKPGGIAFGQDVRIGHDRAGRCIVGFAEPRNPGVLPLCGGAARG